MVPDRGREGGSLAGSLAGGLPRTRRRQPRWGWGWEAGRSRLGLTGRGRTLVASQEAPSSGNSGAGKMGTCHGTS